MCLVVGDLSKIQQLDRFDEQLENTIDSISKIQEDIHIYEKKGEGIIDLRVAT
jgi:hypothetical protein